ncbi:MAG: NifU family protein [Microcoleaceae cyanobacterium MO_207.B10]|nr:NifU family protein [Microcoleaceae cyanobacterium MO_207.B10]
MTQAKIPLQESVSLESLVSEITHFEEAIAHWDENQKLVVEGLKNAIETLHKEALTRLIRSVKQDSMPALREAVQDEVVYGLLRYHELIKPPTPPLEIRIQQALDEVRPGLQGHNGNVELVAIKLPDTVEVKLVGNCSNCPASTLTMKEGVEQAIKTHCPEIKNVLSVNSPVSGKATKPMTSPFAAEQETGWVALANIDEIPEGDILAVDVDGLKLILTRVGDDVIAYRNSCSHLAKPIDKGEVIEGVLSCPFHNFKYHLATGECLTAPEMSLQQYPVTRRGDRILIKC